MVWTYKEDQERQIAKKNIGVNTAREKEKEEDQKSQKNDINEAMETRGYYRSNWKLGMDRTNIRLSI